MYNELAQLIHIGPFTISKQLYITLIKSLFMLKMCLLQHSTSFLTQKNAFGPLAICSVLCSFGPLGICSVLCSFGPLGICSVLCSVLENKHIDRLICVFTMFVTAFFFNSW